MSDERELPPVVRQLLSTAVLSIEELELVLRLRKQGGKHTADALAEALNIPESVTEGGLDSLVLNGLVARQVDSKPPQFEFSAATDELRKAMDELARIYEDHRIEIIMLISHNAIGRVRTGVLQMFSDSFRFTRSKKDG